MLFYRFKRSFFCFRREVSPIPKKRFSLKHRNALVSLIAFLERDLADANKVGKLLRGKEDVGNILSGLAIHRMVVRCLFLAPVDYGRRNKRRRVD